MVNAAGGEPKRLTYRSTGSADNLVATWTPDSRGIVFLSQRLSISSSYARAFVVPATGGLAEPMPLNRSGLMTFGPGGRCIAFTRVFRDFDPRKRYDGGQAQNVYTYDLDSHKLDRITDWKGTDSSPMWHGRRIYFLSDRDKRRRANIWVYDLDSKKLRQVTRFRNYDVDFPSLGGDMITFQQGGRLFALDLPRETLREMRVDVPDDGSYTAARTISVATAIRKSDIMHGVDFAISPHGDRALFAARGRIFSVPSGIGVIRDLGATSEAAVDEDHPAWSPDGRTVAYTTDERGSSQVALRLASGGPDRLVTRFPTGYLFTPIWSPDGASLAVAAVNDDLWIASTDGAKARLIASDPYAPILDASFSPDARWLAYSTARSTQVRAIHIHDLFTGRDVIVSSSMNDDRSPVFSPNGKYLYFISRRTVLPAQSESDGSDIATLQSDGIYVATLDRRELSPFASTPSRGRQGSVRIDLEGLLERAVPLPIEPRTVASIEARGDRIFYGVRATPLIDGELPGETSALRVYDLASKIDATVASGVGDHSLSADGSTYLYERDGVWRTAGTEPTMHLERTLDVSAMRARVQPRREWSEMFEEAWRLDRDVFFDPSMDGDDWRGVRDAYAKFLPLLGSRDDLTYLLTQLQGELASSHTFIGGGDQDDSRGPEKLPLLGVDYELDRSSGRYRFAHIELGDSSRPEFRAPLVAPGLNVRVGDYLLAVNGRELSSAMDPYGVFVGLAESLTLTIASSPGGSRRSVVVDPIDSEFRLRQFDWVERNRRTVDRLSSGRVGYVYLSDFFSDGTKDFVRQFYPQLDKRALVIDERWNRGGHTNLFVIDALRRGLAGSFRNREGASTTLPSAVFTGPKATIENYGTSSDGDQFAYFFRAYGLGPLVGTRSWGGVRGLDGQWFLLDGGWITIPKDALYAPDGRWIIENHGVDPDLTVDDAPDETTTGRDAQLEAAVGALTDRLDHDPLKPAPTSRPLPAYPSTGAVPPSSF